MDDIRVTMTPFSIGINARLFVPICLQSSSDSMTVIKSVLAVPSFDFTTALYYT